MNTSEDTSQDTSKKRKGKRRVKRNTIEALELHNNGVSCEKIAKLQGVSKATIVRDISKLTELMPDNTVLDNLDKHKISLLKATLYNMLSGLNESDKMEKASLNNVAYALTQIHTALRLEEGKSTSNVSYADALRELKLAKKELSEINRSSAREFHESTDSIPIIRECQ